MQFPFEFHKTVVLRSPICAFGNTIKEDEVFAFFKQKLAREALYIASPSIVQELERIETEKAPDPEKKQRLLQSLAKYYNRMRTRSTPFGLFSTISIVEWDNTSEIILAKTIDRFTRFDMQYLCSLSNFAEKQPEIRSRLNFSPNTSLYQYNDTYRYVEHQYDSQGRRSHQISEVDFSDFLMSIFDFCKEGKSIQQLSESIVDEEISYEDAEGFIEELIESQLLLSELEFTLTGPNYVFRFVEILENICSKTDDIISHTILRVVKDGLARLHQIDSSDENDLDVYEALIAQLEFIDAVPIDKKRLFQVDVARGSSNGTLDKRLQGKLKEGLFALTKLSSGWERSAQDQFKKDFITRYEDKELPLLHVLDSENGIGYGSSVVSDDSVLTRDVILPGSNDFKLEHIWDNTEQWKTVRLHKALAQGERTVELTAAELDEFAHREEDINKLAASISVLFSVTESDEIRIETAGNTSALNLLGRFAHCDPRLERTLKEITQMEQERNPNVILAEIVHLPEDRIGNIVQRPYLRDFEIPYLAKSNAPVEHQITLDDLMVSIRWNRIYLRSKRLNKEVCPRMGNAHNFTSKAQPVYQFLAELQFQDVIPYVPFFWNKMDYMYPFLPGVKYKGIILSPAKWFFRKGDLFFLDETDPIVRLTKFEEFKSKYRLPDTFLIADGDNELFINSRDKGSFNMFCAIAKKRDRFLLVEFFAPKNVVEDDEGNIHAHQFVASLIKTTATHNLPVPRDIGKTVSTDLIQKFSIGDDWLYYSLYTGVQTSDRVLIECISPLISFLETNDLISNWFFIRYNDPENHIRIRFLVKNNEHAKVIQLVKNAISPFELSGQIWKITVDTYMREINRYGHTTIDYSEQIFGLDSRNALAMHRAIDVNEFPDYYRWMFGILSVELLFDCLRYTEVEKINLIDRIKDQFAGEFNIGKFTKKILSEKYRVYSDKMEELHRALGEHPFKQILARTKEELQPICDAIIEERDKGKMTVDFQDFTLSHIHMIFNRLIQTNTRKHEMVIYDLIFKHYKKQQALNRKQVDLKPIVQNHEN